MGDLFYYNGRPDGIGNRVEELIYIQQYCEEKNKECIYIWNNTNRKDRSYDCLISFDKIKIKYDITDEERRLINKNCKSRTFGYNVKFKFLFDLPKPIIYDAIIHIRAGDRLKNNHHFDYSNPKELRSFIKKTVKYLNNEKDITISAS